MFYKTKYTLGKSTMIVRHEIGAKPDVRVVADQGDMLITRKNAADILRKGRAMGAVSQIQRGNDFDGFTTA